MFSLISPGKLKLYLNKQKSEFAILKFWWKIFRIGEERKRDMVHHIEGGEAFRSKELNKGAMCDFT